MSKIIVVHRKHMVAVMAAMVTIAFFVWLLTPEADTPASSAKANEVRTIHLVTTEFKTTTEDGKELESYRWDPGTIVVREGETVELVMFGINGDRHPFVIEGTRLTGEVRKGKETVIRFKANRKGTYRILCSSHHDKEENGPMIGYIEVI